MTIQDNYAHEGKYFNLDLQNVSEVVANNSAVVYYNGALNFIEGMVNGRMHEAAQQQNLTADSDTETELQIVPKKLRCEADASAEITFGNANSKQKKRMQQLYAMKPRGKMVFEGGKLLFRPTQKGKGSGSELIMPRIDALGWKISKTKRETKFSVSFPNNISLEEMKKSLADRVQDLNLSLDVINHAYMHASDKADAISRLDTMLIHKREEVLRIINFIENNA